MHVQVGGQKDLFRLAHNLNAAGQKGLKRELDKASRQAGDLLAAEVKRNTATYIPKNFERAWDASFHAKVDVRLVASRRISVTFWADGKTMRRDIVAINRGDLKHPIYGRYRRLKDGSRMKNPWVSRPPQKITAGLVDEPAKRAMPRAVKKIEDAVKRVTQQIEAG